MSLATRLFQRFRRDEVPAQAEPMWAARKGPIRFDDLSETPDPALLPAIDRPDCDEAALGPEQKQWRREGVAILPGFMPDDVLDPYIARRERLRVEAPDHYLGGWYSPTPYEHVPELRDVGLYPPLMRMMEKLLGEPVIMHLNLTGWISTERNWHQDDYLNPPHVNGWYAAAWIALDRIDPGAGPFEYIAGSHRWPLMRQRKVLACMPPEARDARDPVSQLHTWPRKSESFVVPAVEAERVARQGEIRSFIAEKGDVLIWHGRLMHRGSRPTDPSLLRRAMIAHYSGINHRRDMTTRKTDANGMTYFAAGIPLWHEAAGDRPAERKAGGAVPAPSDPPSVT